MLEAQAAALPVCAYRVKTKTLGGESVTSYRFFYVSLSASADKTS